MRYVFALLSLGLFGCTGSTLGTAASVEPANFPVVTTGEVVDLTSMLLEKTVTVFDFYAEWCPPCKKLDLSLKDLKSVYGDKLQVYKLDIVNWDSALAKHHGIRDLPYLIVYDGLEIMGQGPSNQVLGNLVTRLNR